MKVEGHIQSGARRATPDKDAVRKVLDALKADGRTALTAPEGKLVCDAYGIHVPQEGLARSGQEASRLADGTG
jgi:acyl-CoA synthetase (NDP forming)